MGENGDARRHKKPRATLEKTTGNGVKNHEQRREKRRATRFITTGNAI